MSSTEGIKTDVAEAQGDHVKPTAGDDAKAQTTVVDDVPDPDEDDLDDLDDMLNEFSAVKVDSKQPAEASAPPAAAPPAAVPPPAIPADATTSTSQPKPADDQPFSEADFAQQLQAGMAELLGELDKSPDMQAQFEEIFKQMHATTGEGAPAPAPAPAAGESAAKAAPDASADGAADASFQETIRRTMERMQNSGDQATAAAASGGGDDFMAEMLKQLSSGDLGGEGGDEDFSKMLMGMMEQLTNKDILYEPMKELNTKFPDWMEKNKATTSPEDLKRYEEQQTIVAEIVARFETPTYSDSNATDREYIVDRMQKMQAAGSPPTDLVGDMDSAQEAFNMPDDQCNPQ